MTETGRFGLGDLALQSGAVLPDAFLSWKSYGTLSPARDNVVLYPTSYSAQHTDQEWLIGPDGCWTRPDGSSSRRICSPTACHPARPTRGIGRGWSRRGTNVQAQRRLLREQWGIERLHAVYGWSMGAIQAYHWAACFPDAVSRIVVNCGSARTAVHNRVFLKGLMAVLEAAPEHLGNGRFSAQPKAAMRAFGRIYAGWALSQDFYRADLHLSALGAPDLETFLRTDWEERFGRRPAADLYAQLQTWDVADISANPVYGGDLSAALRAIQARVLLMPPARPTCISVLLDNEAELGHLAHAALRPIRPKHLGTVIAPVIHR